MLYNRPGKACRIADMSLRTLLGAPRTSAPQHEAQNLAWRPDDGAGCDIGLLAPKRLVEVAMHSPIASHRNGSGASTCAIHYRYGVWQ
jgi:hypothetical protein